VSPEIALAIAAHPDDTEFMMAGTLARLRTLGAEIHLLNIANGSCGSATLDADEIARVRWREAQASAAVLGATAHPPVCGDLGIVHGRETVARVAAIVRQVRPTIVLTQSPVDYMEDHQNASRIAVTAAFARSMRNFHTAPPQPPWEGMTAVYHALPFGLRDGLRRRVRAGLYVDVGDVMATKRAMLAAHRSQKEWLDVSQGLDSYLATMEAMTHEVGVMSGRFLCAEGFRRHSHLGFAACSEHDPLAAALGPLCVVDQAYERSLENP
jgi:N-acetylglucosamine malate deacetylase 1